MIWDGKAEVAGNSLEQATPINFLNRDKTLDLVDASTVRWKALTTGNFGGADLRLGDARAGSLSVETPLVSFKMPIADIGYEDTVHDQSGDLPRFFKVYRLPQENPHRAVEFTRAIEVEPGRDNPIYVRVTLEDGTRAWTSPIYLYR